MPIRVLVVLVAAVLVAAVAALVLRPGRVAPDGAPSLEDMAEAAGSDIMTLLYRGHVAGRSGEIMLVPKPHHFLIGEWDLRTLGTDRPTMSTSHPNPWDYLTKVPILLYGPRYFEPGTSDEPVDITALAPTFAELLGMRPLEGLSPPLRTGSDATRRPRVIFTVVIDGGGWNALQEHPESWPNIARLMRSGLLYTNATIGSAPSITGALHANFGTGAYPRAHKVPGNQMRAPDGSNVDTWLENADPRFLEMPTISELWDEQNGNGPLVATVSYEGWHLGMIGHGAGREGGDKDIAVLWEPDDSEWWINEDFYALPAYLEETDLARLERYEEALDPRDGLRGDGWFGHSLEDLQDPLTRPATPAFVRFTGDAVVEVMRREGIGRDGLTDLMWVEMKMPDYAGHAWNVTGREQADVIAETDRQIGRFVAELDRSVGKDGYVFALSADHGQQPLPDLVGGWRINNKELQRDLEERFGDVVEKVTPVDIYLDADALEREDVEPEDIARYIGTYTVEENVPMGAPGAENVPEARLDDELFAGAFTTEFLESLSADDLERFGCGRYEQGWLDRTVRCAEIAGSEATPGQK